MPGSGQLRFVPLKPAKGYVRRPGIAMFDADGRYRARSFKPGDGLFPGEYAVIPSCWEVEQVMGGPPAKSYLPARYHDAANPQFKVLVREGEGAQTFDFNIEP